jgi:hypothetical protein
MRVLFAVAALIVLASALQEEINEDFSEASQAVEVMLQEGKSDSACRKLANGSKLEISNGQKNTQGLVNRMDVGKNCHTAGLAAYQAAKRRETSARNQYHSANNACNRAKGARVQVGARSLSQFKVSCAAFLNDGKYIAAKRHMTNTCNDVIRKKAVYDNSRKASASAMKAHQKAKVACACRAQKNYKAAVKSTKNFNSAANAKAWTKAHHMMCVLDGKPANKCAVPRVPRVTAPRMPSWVARTRCVTNPPLACRMSKAEGNGASVIKPHFPGKGYQLVGGGMNNRYRHFNLTPNSIFQEAFPWGNHFRCGPGYPGRVDCYAMYCKKSGMRCTTNRSPRQRKSGYKIVYAPRGYTMTGGGLNNHSRRRPVDKRAHFERSAPDNNGWIGDMGAGWGDYTVYVRSCTGLSCQTKHSSVGNSKVVSCPSGYKVTSCGSHQMNGWGKLGAFEQYNFHGNGCHCDMGFGHGKQRCYARCCK